MIYGNLTNTHQIESIILSKIWSYVERLLSCSSILILKICRHYYTRIDWKHVSIAVFKNCFISGKLCQRLVILHFLLFSRHLPPEKSFPKKSNLTY